ncbi:MAG TPA: RDD family protein [Blastocatellia bacterium]|nr:RDD family protein [Blastocatellia bacterium]
MSTGVDQRFCPYCGKPLSQRARFCPSCGKASIQRHRSTGVIVEENAPAPKHEDPYSKLTTARPDEGAQSLGRPRPAVPERKVVSRPSNGSADTGFAPPYARRIAPPTHSFVGQMEQAGFGLRYGAWMFDFLITLIAIMTFTFVVTAVSRRSVVGSNTDLVLVSVLTLLLFVLNFIVLAGSNGQSAGMRILGIRIARVDGRPFTIKDAVVRHLIGYPLSMAGFFLGFLWMLWDPRQQGWHDKLARTVVVMSR